MGTNRIAALFPDHAEPARDYAFEALAPKRRFSPGCRVRVSSGMMKGIDGTVLAYCSNSRLIIAVDLNWPGVTLEIDEERLTRLDG